MLVSQIPKCVLSALVIFASLSLIGKFKVGYNLVVNCFQNYTTEGLFDALLFWMTFSGVILVDVDVGLEVGMLVACVVLLCNIYRKLYKQYSFLGIK